MRVNQRVFRQRSFSQSFSIWLYGVVVTSNSFDEFVFGGHATACRASNILRTRTIYITLSHPVVSKVQAARALALHSVARVVEATRRGLPDGHPRAAIRAESNRWRRVAIRAAAWRVHDGAACERNGRLGRAVPNVARQIFAQPPEASRHPQQRGHISGEHIPQCSHDLRHLLTGAR